jgi:hypothetical protein
MNKIYLKSREYIEGWLKGAGWELKIVSYQIDKNILSHYIHPHFPGFTYNIAMFDWLDSDISDYIVKCPDGNLNKNLYNLFGCMIQFDWLEEKTE